MPEAEFSDRGEHPLFPEICGVYGTQHLPSVFRTLAANRVLEETWAAVGPFLASPEGATAVARVGRQAGIRRERSRGCLLDTERARPNLDQFSRARLGT